MIWTAKYARGPLARSLLVNMVSEGEGTAMETQEVGILLIIGMRIRHRRRSIVTVLKFFILMFWTKK